MAASKGSASASPKGTATVDDATLYREQLKGAIQFRNTNNRITRWKEYARIVAHNYTGGTDTTQPVVNIMAARTRSIGPMLAFNEPTFEVTSVGELPNPNSEASLAVVLEKAWREEEVGPVMARVLMDWPTLGRGIFFVGFEAAQEGQVLDAKRNIAATAATFDQQTKNSGIIDKARKLLGMNTQNPIDPPSEVRTFKMLLGQRVFAERVSPFDFVLDPAAQSPQDATFMARRMFLPLERAQLMFGVANCPVADSIANVALYTNETDSDPFGVTQSIPNLDKFPDSVRRVEVWEVWNIVTRKTVYIDKNGTMIGTPFDWKSAHPGFPFVLLDWDEVMDSVWPEGLCAAMHTLNNELNEVRKRELAELGKAWGVWAGPKTMSAEDRKKLTAADDGAFIGLEPEDVENLKPLVRQPLPADVWSVENRIMANLDELSHMNSNVGGGMNPVRRTATEVAQSGAGTDASMAYRQLQVEQAAEQIAERMAAAIFATFDTPIIVRIQNQDGSGGVVAQDGTAVFVGEEIDFPFVGTENAGFYKVKVTSGSMASVARDVERQQAMMVVQAYGQQPWFDLEAFALHHLGMFPSIKDPARYVKKVDQPNQDPQLPMPPAQAGAPVFHGEGQPPLPGPGSGNPQADLMAGVQGGMGPGTGVNGSV